MSRVRSISVFLIFTFIFQLPAWNIFSQERTYYWFYIKVDKTFDKETGMNRIVIKNTSSDVESGSFAEFAKRHQNGLKTGKIYLGPFSEQGQCMNAQSYYRNPGRSSSNSSEFGADDTYSYFLMKPIADDLSQNIKFEQIPSRVTSGTLDDFISMLGEGLSFDKLAIGPFNAFDLAERSKYVYLKSCATKAENVTDSSKIQELRIMAKKWKTLNLEITKQGEDKETGTITYRFSTKFPRKYFASDAFQVITITAMYTEPVDNSSNSFTLQGDGVVDNNPVISFEMGTVYINVLNFDRHPDNKIKGFNFDCFVYNDTDMIELEPIFVAVNKNLK